MREQEESLAKLESAQAKLEPALDELDETGELECMSDARYSQLSKRIDEAWARVQAAQLAARDAEIGLLRAQLEESEAESALRLLQWGHTADALVAALQEQCA